jgi:methionyl-tRNA formyltransferase
MINGETETGYTLHRVDEGIDSGPVIDQLKISINPDENINGLFSRVKPVLYKWVKEKISELTGEKIKQAVPQDPGEACYYSRRTEKDGFINWQQPATKVYDFIRAQVPPYAPGAFTFWNNEKIIILESCIGIASAIDQPAGTIAGEDEEAIQVHCETGIITIKTVLYQNQVCSAAVALKNSGMAI